MAGNILIVGPGQQYSAIADAVADARNGDTIQVMAGSYINDFAEINKNITLEGIGGTVNMVCDGLIPNGKGIFVTNGNITVNNFAFSGAQVDDNNGAGIRYESGNLILNNDYFHDNQMGLLGGFDPSGSITVSTCEFANNGVSDPGSGAIGHNLYVGDVVGTLTIDNSYFHDAQIGHEIKSRALNTIVTNSRIQDGPTSTASYSIDLPNGGNALIQNNVIEKGPLTENQIIIEVGAEGSVYDNTSIQIAGNQIINDRSSSVIAVWNATTAIAQITGNQFYGLTESQVVEGLGALSDNQFFARNATLLGAPVLDMTMLDSLGASGGTVNMGHPSDAAAVNWTGTPVKVLADTTAGAGQNQGAILSGAGLTIFGAGRFGAPTSYSSSADLIGSDPLTHFAEDPQLLFKN
jgi:hypothetical protein